jgi:zinc D-Ala-D-Ala carboxypeptidase
MVPARWVRSVVAGPEGRTYAPRSMRPRSLVRHGALAAALALVTLAVVRPGVAPATVLGMGALPACRYDDIMTQPRSYGDWAITLVDTILRVPRSYVPPDLVSVAEAGIPGHGKVRAVMIDDLRAMTEAATAAGNPIGVTSAYRSYDDQVSTFAHWVSVDGYAGALKVSARPGHSEHQLGLAIDFRSQPANATLSESWAQTPAGKWMNQHAWEYGFIRSYPAHKQGITCYSSEPWHFRYVGRDEAATIRASGLTTREFLWANDTTAVVPNVTPKPPKSPGHTAPPTTPSLEPSASPPPMINPTAIPASPIADAPPLQSAGASMPAEAPGRSAPPLDAAPAASVDPTLLEGTAIAVIAIIAVTVLAMRRGRSGQSG